MAVCFAQGSDDAGIGRNDPAFELTRRQRSGPAVEQLHRLGPSVDLPAQIVDRHALDRHQQFFERDRVAVRHSARIVLVAAALALHHIRRDGPRAASKAQHRDTGVNLRAHLGDSVVNRRKASRHGLQRIERAIEKGRRQAGAFTGNKFQVLPHRIGHDQDIGKQDRPVEPETAQWLHSDLGSGIAIVDKVEKPPFCGTQCAVFGQIAARLPHHPEWWPGVALAQQRIEERSRHDRASAAQNARRKGTKNKIKMIL